MSQPAGPTDRNAAGLGAFAGVFTPSVVTILGIILFLRLGWVVGQGGLWMALGLIGLAHVVSIVTSFSLAAIATNRRVKGGGDYYLISRSLGPEFGCSLGIILFLAQSTSVAFYCLGFGEAVHSLLGDSIPLTTTGIAIAAAVVVFAIAWAGADVATRFQVYILAAIVISLISFVWGATELASAETLADNWAAPEFSPSFWVLFAVFFPAVTGFTQGVSMSGDLAEPSKSLPLGTFAAVTVSLVAYGILAVLFAASAPLAELGADFRAFERTSASAIFFHAGVIAATLSSALASAMGAPRILQALARDEILPALSPFAYGTKEGDNPRRGIALSAVIAFGIFALGELNAIAGLISMFFLISYGLLNFATYVESHGGSPSFRPRFQYFDARVSLAGGVLCLVSMLAIDLTTGLVAIATAGALYRYLLSRNVEVPWSDSRPAFTLRRLKAILQQVERLEPSEWDWQPNIVLYAESPERRKLLLEFAASLSTSSGFTSCLGVVEGESEFETSRVARAELEEKIRAEIAASTADAYPLAMAAPDLHRAIGILLQTWGLGSVRVNTVLLDWYRNFEDGSPYADLSHYGRALRSIGQLDCNLLVTNIDQAGLDQVAKRAPEERRIDVWWWEESSCRLGLLIALMLTHTESWEHATIRVLAPCASDQDQRTIERVQKMLKLSRIDATVEAVPDATAVDLIERSRGADLVIVRIDTESMRPTGPFDTPLDELLPSLPMACLVAAAAPIRLSDPEA